MEVSTLLEILQHEEEEEQDIEGSYNVSTLLEILLEFADTAPFTDDLIQFQPFLRFYGPPDRVYHVVRYPCRFNPS